MTLDKLNRFKFNLPLIILSLVPYSFIIGPLFLEIVASCISIYFLFSAFKKKNLNLIKNNLIYFFILFYLYILFRSIFSFDPIFSLKSSFFYFRFIFFVLGILLIITQYKNAEKLLLKNSFISVILVFSGVIFEYLYYSKFSPYYNKDYVRFFSLFINEPIPGSYMSRMLPFAILGYFCFFKKIDTKLNYKNLLSIFLLASVVISIYITGERTSFFYSIFILFILIIFSNLKIIFKLLVLGLFFLLFFAVNTFDDRVNKRMISFSKNQIFGENNSTFILDNDLNNIDQITIDLQQEREAKANKFPGFSPEHKRHYYSAYLMFRDNIFFGQGPRTFRKLCQKESFFVPGACTTHPHNTILQILSELGLIGLIFYLIILIFIIKFYLYLFIKKYFYFKLLNKNENIIIFYYCALSISFFPFITAGNFFNNWLSYFYFLPIAFILKRSKKF